MPIVAADLVKYGVANYPEADTGTSGGAISLVTALRRFVQASNTAPKAASSSAGDTTQTLTIFGRLMTGAADSEAITLNGTTQITFTKTYIYLTKATLSATAAGTVTIFMNDGSTVIVTIAPGITKQIRLFNNSESEASQTIRYEGEWWKNNHGSLTLQAAKIRLTADASAKIRIGLANGADQTVTNRKTAPSSVTFVDDSVDIDVTSVAAGSSKQIWVEQTLTASDSPYNSTYTTELRGTTAA